MALPDSFMREIHDRNDIVSVISGYISLKQRGRTRVGLCPFHGEKTPSFTVYPDTQSFYCYGCGVGGDVITFTMKMDNLDYIDAVKELAQRSGMSMPEYESDKSGIDREVKRTVLNANTEAARFYYKTLYSPEGKPGLDYFRNDRRLTDATIRSFGLGFAPESPAALTDYLIQEKGFRAADLVTANLTIIDKQGRYIDRFRGRVMFPIIDARGNVVAFGGRIMTDEKPKYLNTSDTPVYKKTNNFFALNLAKKTKADHFILCEGYMDCIALYQAGFDNVLAGLGTALTEQQVKLFKRYKNKAVLCYDSDEAGQKAAMRAIMMFDKLDMNTFVIKVPDGKDPDEYLKRHGENGYIRFKQIVDKADNEVDYFFGMLAEKYNYQTVEGKIYALNEAARFLAELSSPLKRDVYAGRISEQLNVSKESMEEIIAKVRREFDLREQSDTESLEQERMHIYVPESLDTSILQAKSKRAGKAEESLISCLLTQPELYFTVKDKLKASDLTMPLAAAAYKIIAQRAENGQSTQLYDLAGEMTENEYNQLARIVGEFNEKQLRITPRVCAVYADAIIEESQKRTPQELSQESDESVMEDLRRMKEFRKRKRSAQQ
ncbi:MAG: DNA primase [Clostridia bacterium]|nr:DNA primase [Clostridia bacterium]